MSLLNSSVKAVEPQNRTAEVHQLEEVVPQVKVTFEEGGYELQVTRREKGEQDTFPRERHGGRLPVPVQVVLQGLIPADVAKLRALPEKHQDVFSKDEVTTFDDWVKGVHDRPKTGSEVAFSTTNTQPKVGKGLMIASPLGLSSDLMTVYQFVTIDTGDIIKYRTSGSQIPTLWSLTTIPNYPA